MITKARGYLARASSLLSKDAGAGGEREKLDVAATCLCAGASTSQLLDSPGAGGGFLGGRSDSIFSKIFIHSKHC